MTALADFITTRQSKFVNVDKNPYGAQCVELANDWCMTLGIESFPFTDAWNFEFHSHPDCDWIDNTPTNIPKPGAIMVWAKTPSMPSGHVDIFVDGDVNTFHGFDENWPLNTPAHIQAHTYIGVAGWLHPRVLNALPQVFPLASVTFGAWLAAKRPDTMGKPPLAVLGEYLKEAYPKRTDLQQGQRTPGDWLQQLLGEAIKETQA